MTIRTSIPFNVKILELTDRKVYGIKPVRSLDIFDGMTDNLHEDGLFSLSIFGAIGDSKRDTRFSYIPIKIQIFHPLIYSALVELKRLYAGIMAGTEYAVWNPIIKDFDKSNPIDGETGFHFFIQHWKEIEFVERKSISRQDMIKLIEKYKSVALTDKIVIIPAGLRDLEIGDDGRVRKDEINDLYSSLIRTSNAINIDSVKDHPNFYNAARWKLQTTFNSLYAMLEGMVKGKKKFFLDRFASRRIQNGTRNVITSMITNNLVLGDPGNITFNHTSIGLYQTMKMILPIAKYQIKTGYISRVLVSPNIPVDLIDKETLEIVPTRLDIKYFDRWQTDEGLDKVINSFSEESIRHNPIEIEGKYLALIYKGPDNTFKLFQDINDLPKGWDRKYVFPATLAEILYISLYTEANKYPCFVTRYPIAGMGSIYPSKIYLKTTLKYEQRIPLDDQWKPIDDPKMKAYQFPMKGSRFLNSASIASARLAGLGADPIQD